MIKKSLLIISLLFLLCTTIQQGSAQTYNSPANTGPFGIGIILGEPTGLVAKYWLNPTLSVDADFAWSFVQGGFIYTQLALQYTLFNLLDNPDMRFPFFIGGGARLRFSGLTTQDTLLGLLIPLGVNFDFRQLPIDAFIEIAPGVDLFPTPSFILSGGIGARYYF